MCKVVYKHGTFTDYKGTEIEFTLAAVSIPKDCVVFSADSNESLICPKVLSIGAAFRNPHDAPDDILGENVAYGKAISRTDHMLITSDKGLINTRGVEAILEQEAAYIQVNPGRYIAGYDSAKKKYEEAKAEQEYLDSLTDQEKLAIDVMARTKEPDKFLKAVEKHRKNISRPDGIVCTKFLSQKDS